jgi:predicted DNA-binding protein
MIINKKTYKILNIFIVAIFLFVLIIYSTFFNNLANQTDRYNKSYYVQKSIDGYLLEVEGLFFKEREKRVDSQSYFRGASNPMTAFKDLEKDLWLDFILVSIQNNYNQNGKCFFKPSVSRNVINIYKINSGSQEEISPSIDIKLNYTSNQKTQIDECLAFINNLISKVNA